MGQHAATLTAGSAVLALDMYLAVYYVGMIDLSINVQTLMHTSLHTVCDVHVFKNITVCLTSVNCSA